MPILGTSEQKRIRSVLKTAKEQERDADIAYKRREKQLKDARDLMLALEGPDRELVMREMGELRAREEEEARKKKR